MNKFELNSRNEFNKWLQYGGLDPELKDELAQIESITDKAEQEVEIDERFHENIKFGTGGIRGIIGAGTCRINKYTIQKATQGLAEAVLLATDTNTNKPSVAIAYDCRHKSKEFAKQAACVLTANGIKVYLFREITPTPILSFAIRKLQATAGIVITASHNPPEYNGYKVYWSDGGQVATSRAEEIMAKIEAVTDIFAIRTISMDTAQSNGLLEWLEVDGEVMNAYYNCIRGIVLLPFISDKSSISDKISTSDKSSAELGGELRLVYTPLHGAASRPLQAAFELVGYKPHQIVAVKEQTIPDSSFSTVKSPNPEDPVAFELALDYARNAKADIIVATDPDGDRLGVMALDDKADYRLLTGNQLGALLLEYILSARQAQGKLAPNSYMVKTIVTSELGRKIANHYGVKTEDTLTGFKYIAERMAYHESNTADDNTLPSQSTTLAQFQFGYEESYGYLVSDFVRDKDGIQAAIMAAEVASYYKSKQKTLFDALKEIYDKYGYYQEDLLTVKLEGIAGQERIVKMMDKLRQNRQQTVVDIPVAQVIDYQYDETGLPKSNVLKYTLADESWFAMRPSGTEPKLKFYFSVVGKSENDAVDKLLKLKMFIKQYFELQHLPLV